MIGYRLGVVYGLWCLVLFTVFILVWLLVFICNSDGSFYYLFSVVLLLGYGLLCTLFSLLWGWWC